MIAQVPCPAPHSALPSIVLRNHNCQLKSDYPDPWSQDIGAITSQDRAGWPLASSVFFPRIDFYNQIRCLHYPHGRVPDHNSENTIMDNFEFIIQFYTVFPPSLARPRVTRRLGERRGAGGFGTSGEE